MPSPRKTRCPARRPTPTISRTCVASSSSRLVHRAARLARQLDLAARLERDRGPAPRRSAMVRRSPPCGFQPKRSATSAAAARCRRGPEKRARARGGLDGELLVLGADLPFVARLAGAWNCSTSWSIRSIGTASPLARKSVMPADYPGVEPVARSDASRGFFHVRGVGCQPFVPARALLLLALCVVTATLTPGCRSTGSPPATATFVGSAACTRCHETQHRSWETSYHHLAMLPASLTAPLHARPGGDFPLVARDGRLFLSGERLQHPSDVPVEWVLGHRTIEQYLGALSPGSVQALPLAFDVQRGEWFDLFAGESRTPADWGHWTNRGMTANARCIACHTTGFEKGYRDGRDTYDESLDARSASAARRATAPARTRRSPQDGRHRSMGRARPGSLLAACGGCHSRSVERAPWTPGDCPSSTPSSPSCSTPTRSTPTARCGRRSTSWCPSSRAGCTPRGSGAGTATIPTATAR